MNLISYGRKYYERTGSGMGALYTENGERSDWGHVEAALAKGDSVFIRPATAKEHAAMHEATKRYIAAAKAEGWSGPWELEAP